MKHRKKSNTSLIFDLLTKHYTKSLLEGQDDKSKEIFKLIVKYFKPNSPLAEELSLCNILLRTNINSFETGSRLLSEVKNAAKYLDETAVKDMKFSLLLEIYEVIGKEFFTLPIKHYKKHASAYKLINDYKGNVKIKNISDRITLEEEVISSLIDGELMQEGKKIDRLDTRTRLAERLAYKLYDEKYSSYFLGEDKVIINEYLINANFKEFAKNKLNEIKEFILSKKDVKDENVEKKLREAVDNIDKVSSIDDKHELAYNLILYQELVDELKNI